MLTNKYKNIFYRYIFLLTITLILVNPIFSNILVVIFTYISYYVLNIFYFVELIDMSLYIDQSHLFLIVRECIAISAYTLITIIFFSIPMKIKQSLKLWSKAAIVFTIANLLRILILMFVELIFGKETFETIHLIFYEFVSGVIVALIIIYYLKKSRTKGYPFYDDLKLLIGEITKKNK